MKPLGCGTHHIHLSKPLTRCPQFNMHPRRVAMGIQWPLQPEQRQQNLPLYHLRPHHSGQSGHIDLIKSRLKQDQCLLTNLPFCRPFKKSVTDSNVNKYTIT